MDPTVLEEGCMVPWLSPATFYGIEDRETEDQGVEPNVPGFTGDDILRTALETGQTTVQVRTSLRKVLDFIDGAVPGNEPADHDSYIDYLSGKTPGLDGVTYVDGSRNEETDG
jgi:hypothetical protein